MPIPESLNRNLALPVICAPMFIVSNPDLVIAQCKAGLIGSFPALNARPMEVLDDWLTRIKTELAVDLPHPRHYRVKTSPEFMDLKARLTEEIRAESLAADLH